MAEDRNEVFIALRLPEVALTLGQPLIAELSVVNRMDEGIELDLGHGRKAHLQFTIRRPDGSTVTPRPLKAEGFGRLGGLSLRPGQEYTQALVLNEWYSPGECGEYGVDLRLTSTVRTCSGRVVTPSYSAPVTLRLAPRDPARLEEVCEKLTAKVTSSSDVEEAMGAALALSHVRDAIAVPYLERALGGRVGGTDLVLGLGRIANPEAIEVLLTTIESSDEESRSLSRWVLHQLMKTSRDPQLRERIARALRRSNVDDR